MSLTLDSLQALSAGGSERLTLPDYRQIELYSKRKSLDFAEPLINAGPPATLIAEGVRAFWVLEALAETRSPSQPGQTRWQRYVDLPRLSALDKLIAELFRVARILREVAFHPHGHIDYDGGVVRCNGAIHGVALSLELTPAGLRLLTSAVAYVVQALASPYPLAYVEALTLRYFVDLVAEIKRFADEDRILYQFRQPKPFARHYRFDCDNPKLHSRGDTLMIDVGPRYCDRTAYPIDFFALFDGALHIIPIEALSHDHSLLLGELPRWQARLSAETPATLPAAFRARFGREEMVIGQPMT